MIVTLLIPVCMCCFQAECDELAQRADVLKEENATLRLEISRIRSEYEQLLSENTALKVILNISIIIIISLKIFNFNQSIKLPVKSYILLMICWKCRNFYSDKNLKY